MHHVLSKPTKILLSTISLYYLAGAMLGPLYAIFVEDIGGDILDASYAFSVFAIAAGVTAYISGKYTDSIKENELIISFGLFIVSLGFFSYILVSEVWHLAFPQILIGLGGAIMSPAFESNYAKHLYKNAKGQGWGAWEVTYYFTSAIGALIGGFVVTYFGFNPLFLIMGILTSVSSLYIYFLPRKAL